MAVVLTLQVLFVPIGQSQENKIPTEVFASLPNASNVSLSPKGTWLGMLREIQGRTHVYMQLVGDTSTYRLIPPNEDFEIRWYQWVNDDWVILSLYAETYIDGTKVVQSRLMSFNVPEKKFIEAIKPSKRLGTGTRLSRHRVPQIQDRVVDILKDEPNHILVAVDGDWDGYTELRKVDITSGSFDDEYEDKRGVQEWEVDHQGNLRMAWGYDIALANDVTKFYYFKPGTESMADYTRYQASELGLMPVGYTDDLNVVIMRQNYSDRTDRLLTYNMETNKIVDMLHDHEIYAPGAILREPTGGSVFAGKPIGYSYIADTEEIVIWDEEWAKLYRTINKLFKGATNTIVSATDDMRALIVYSRSDIDPGVYYYWNRDTKELSEMVLVNPSLDPASLSPMQAISYKARDGQDIPAYLTVPKGVEAKNLPLVVMPHGGPHARDYKTYDHWVQFLANRGYAVLQPNFRGSTGYASAYENAGRENWGLLMQDDVTDGVQHLIDEGIANPNRVCIVGASYGGYAALMGAVKTPDLYKCAASINGVTSLTSLIRSDKKFIGGDVWTQSIGDIGADMKKLLETSPAERADEIKIPILLIQFEDDLRVPERQADLMVDAMEDADVEHTYLSFGKGGHSMVTKESRMQVLNALEAFLTKNLQ